MKVIFYMWPKATAVHHSMPVKERILNTLTFILQHSKSFDLVNSSKSNYCRLKPCLRSDILNDVGRVFH